MLKSLPSIAGAAASAAMALLCAAASAQPGGNIFTCTTAKGQHLRSDRPIAECMDREQRVLARDGSLLRVVPANLTLQEMAAKNERDRRLAAAKESRREAERADRLLLQRYPDEASHEKARLAAIAPVRESLGQSEQRIRALAVERKPLAEEAEFYKSRPLPAALKQKFDANDAAAEAQRLLVSNQRSEMLRVNALYDIELARLKKLWAGAAPGSLGAIDAPQAEPQAQAQLAASARDGALQQK